MIIRRFQVARHPRSDTPRNLRIDGRRTSMRLEDVYWSALEEIAAATRIDVTRLVERIAAGDARGNRSSAIRVYVLAWFRRARRRRPARRLRPQRGPV
jgi:predicted DNA-binding ribbon-helix-helix protein